MPRDEHASGPAASSGGLSSAELAARAGVSEDEITRLVDGGLLVPRDGERPFRSTDLVRIRFAQACEDGGLPMASLVEAIRAGHLSFAFVESWPFERRGDVRVQSYAELAEETDISFAALQRVLEAFGFPRPEPTQLVSEGPREIASLVGRALVLGIIDEVTSVRLGHLYAEAFRRISSAETEIYHSGIEMPLLRSGAGARATMERAGEIGASLVGLLDDARMAAYRRQQELMWTEHQIEHIEQAMEDAGISLPAGPPPAMCFLDLSGYTRLTEERGDREAAALVTRLSDVVQRNAREHRGEPVKWVGDGVMVRFHDPNGAVLSALDMVEEIPATGLPAAHVGIAAGPVIRQAGDYFGRTVNLASRISDRAAAGQVLVSEQVVQAASAPGVAFVGIGPSEFAGVGARIDLFEARRRR